MRPQEARALMARHARSFAPAARVLARRDRDRVARLYALCRLVDDLADEDGSDIAAARLAGIAHDLTRRKSADPIAAEARALFRDRPDGLRAFGELLAGVRSDMTPMQIPDPAGLDAYCHAVAGTVGIMVCTLFDVAPCYHAPAAALGRAMQLTNICRDVAEDAARGRRYLPGTLCPHTPDRIAHPDALVRADVVAAVGVMLARADTLYAGGRSGYHALPLRLRLAVASAAGMYRGIGHELRRRGGDPLRGAHALEHGAQAGLCGFGLARGDRTARSDAGSRGRACLTSMSRSWVVAARG